MGTFKHHSYFPKEKAIQNYLFPNVCFVCRKCFRKPEADKPNSCPNCAGEMVALNRKFKAPKSHDMQQWKKVQFLVGHGFKFQSVYETKREDGIVTCNYKVNYPQSIEEAKEFVVKFRDQAIK